MKCVSELFFFLFVHMSGREWRDSILPIFGGREKERAFESGGGAYCGALRACAHTHTPWGSLDNRHAELQVIDLGFLSYPHRAHKASNPEDQAR